MSSLSPLAPGVHFLPGAVNSLVLEDGRGGALLGSQDLRQEVGVVVQVLPYGLTVHAIRMYHDGEWHDLLAGPENPADHARYGRRFFGQIVGRYANRLPAGPSEAGGVRVDLAEWGT